MSIGFESKLARLEGSVSRLLKCYSELSDQNKALEVQCKRLEEEKEALQSKHEHWLAERAVLVQSSEATRMKLEAILSRLKSLDQHP